MQFDVDHLLQDLFPYEKIDDVLEYVIRKRHFHDIPLGMVYSGH